jgi:ProP effector
MTSKVDVRPIIAELAERFPNAFFLFEKRRRPLKIGIFDDILARLDGAIEPGELEVGLSFYCNNWAYLKNCDEGIARVDLDGQPCGAVSAADAEYAKRKLDAHNTKRAARLTEAASKQTPKIIPAEKPKPLSLADLRAAALARRAEQRGEQA